MIITVFTVQTHYDGGLRSFRIPWLTLHVHAQLVSWLFMIRSVCSVILMNQLLCVFLFTAMERREWIVEMTYTQNSSTSGACTVRSLEECGVLLTVDVLHL